MRRKPKPLNEAQAFLLCQLVRSPGITKLTRKPTYAPTGLTWATVYQLFRRGYAEYFGSFNQCARVTPAGRNYFTAVYGDAHAYDDACMRRHDTAVRTANARIIEAEIDEMDTDGRLTALAMTMAIDAGVDWPSLDGDAQAAWHERAVERLRGTDV